MFPRTPRHLLALLPMLPAIALGACATQEQPPAAQTPFVRGTAKVVSVNAVAGHAVLDLQGRRIDAYWQTEVAAAQGGSTIQPDVNKAPVGIYHEPEVHAPTFDAQPGDTIAFLGMQTGNSIFLQGIAVISH